MVLSLAMRHSITLLNPRLCLRRNPRLVSLDLHQQHGQFIALPPHRQIRLPSRPDGAQEPAGGLAASSASRWTRGPVEPPTAPAAPCCRVACPNGVRARRIGIPRQSGPWLFPLCVTPAAEIRQMAISLSFAVTEPSWLRTSYSGLGLGPCCLSTTCQYNNKLR